MWVILAGWGEFRKSEEHGVVYPDMECGCTGVVGKGSVGIQAHSGFRACHSLAPGCFLAFLPSVAFQGALDLWQHNFVLSVFTPCFSFPVPLWLLVLSLRCLSSPLSLVIHILSGYQGPAYIPLPPWGFPIPLTKHEVIFPSCNSQSILSVSFLSLHMRRSIISCKVLSFLREFLSYLGIPHNT